MEAGELWMRWSVRLAMMLYLAGLGLRGLPGSRLLWTAGCGAYLVHVACAFAYYHDWSHAEAYAATARQTAATVGIDWGGGVWFNYAFTAVWLADVCWWWIAPKRYWNRPRWLDWSIQGFLAFIAFNATVVFATGFSLWVGVAGCILLPAMALAHGARRKSERAKERKTI